MQMQQRLSARDVESAVKNAGLTMKEFCRRIGLAQSVFSRWKHEVAIINLRTYDRIVEGVAVLYNGNHPVWRVCTKDDLREDA